MGRWLSELSNNGLVVGRVSAHDKQGPNEFSDTTATATSDDTSANSLRAGTSPNVEIDRRLTLARSVERRRLEVRCVLFVSAATPRHALELKYFPGEVLYADDLLGIARHVGYDVDSLESRRETVFDGVGPVVATAVKHGSAARLGDVAGDIVNRWPDVLRGLHWR